MMLALAAAAGLSRNFVSGGSACANRNNCNSESSLRTGD
jgi:hypothetical protein